MNYHLMIDDKFIDEFIKSAEQVSPHKNYYIFTFNSPGFYVKSDKGLYAPYGSEALDKILGTINEQDRLYVHWFKDESIDYIIRLNLKIPIYLFFWGGDFIEQTKEFIDFNLDYLTKKIFYRNEKLKVFHWTRHPLNYLTQIKNYILFERRGRTKLAEKKDVRKAFLKRLNYFCHWNLADLKRIERAYDCNPQFMDFFYNISLEKITYLNVKSTIKNAATIIWVGNSASYTNNHLDVLQAIKKFKNNNIKVFFPLSYGQKKYGNFIAKKGKQVFNEKFISIRDFMPLNEYFELLENVNVVVMYHNRTQAAGNIFAFIKMGKKVYLKKQSTIYELLHKNSIKVFDANTIKDLSFEEFAEPLPDKDAHSNAEKILRMFSEERKLACLGSILN